MFDLTKIPFHENLESHFKTPNGRFLTQSLFYETCLYDFKYALYTLSDHDKHKNGKTYYSLKNFYMEVQDQTEYEFAVQYLGGWEHWKRLVNNSMLNPYIEKWREELEVKLRSQGLKTIVNLSKDNLNAAKYLSDKGWDVKRGRPTKEDVKKERKQKAMIMEELDEDAKRLGL